MKESALERYRRLQQLRGPKERDSSVAPILQSFIRDQTRAAKSLAAVTEAFEAVVPREVADACTLVGLRAGVLTIETSSPAAQYAVDRVLRGGGEAALRGKLDAAGIRMNKIRVRYAASER